MLKHYLDERARRYRLEEPNRFPSSIELKNAKYIWNLLRFKFLETQDICSDKTITLYLTTVYDGHFYYSDGVFFKKLVEQYFICSSKTLDAIMQLAIDDGITVSRRNEDVWFQDHHHLSCHKGTTVYIFSYSPPLQEE